MKKILISIILISCLVVPMVSLAGTWVRLRSNNQLLQVDLIWGDDGKTLIGFHYGELDYGPDTFAIVGGNPPMDFTPTTCRIRHDLSDYGPCAGWTAPNEVTGFTDCCLIDKILTIGDYVFVLLLVVAVIVFLIGAFWFLTAQGEPDKVKNARNYVIYSIIGIAVAFLAKVLVRVVASIMT